MNETWLKVDAFKQKLKIGGNKYDTTHLKGSISCLQFFGAHMDAAQILYHKDCHWASKDGTTRNSPPCPTGAYYYHGKCYEVKKIALLILLIIEQTTCWWHWHVSRIFQVEMPPKKKYIDLLRLTFSLGSFQIGLKTMQFHEAEVACAPDVGPDGRYDSRLVWSDHHHVYDYLAVLMDEEIGQNSFWVGLDDRAELASYRTSFGDTIPIVHTIWATDGNGGSDFCAAMPKPNGGWEKRKLIG